MKRQACNKELLLLKIFTVLMPVSCYASLLQKIDATIAVLRGNKILQQVPVSNKCCSFSQWPVEVMLMYTFIYIVANMHIAKPCAV